MLRTLQNSIRTNHAISSIFQNKLYKYGSSSCSVRWKSSEPKPYKAAILEEFNEKLIIQPITNRTKLGDGMVFCCHLYK